MSPLLLLVLPFLSKMLKGKKTADRLEYTPINLEVIKGNLVYTMEVLNPTKNPLKVDSFFGNIFADDTKIGSIERGTPFDIGANKRTTVKLPVKLNPVGFLKIAANFSNLSKLKGMKYKIIGIARALGIDNNVTQDLSLNA